LACAAPQTKLAYVRFGPLDPLAVEAAVQIYHKLADDED
jgi:hypothetical protein